MRKKAVSNHEIPPGTGQLEFHYTALSFQVPEKVRFKFKLDGMDADWIDAGTKRVANYNRVPPGKYRFRVMASNNDGVWNEAGAEMPIVLLPHVWQTIWFRFGVPGLFLTVIIFSVHFFSTRKLHRQIELSEQQHAERSRIARDIHDNMGAQLTEILLLNELARTKNNREEIETHLRKQSHVAREAARTMDSIIWAVNPQNEVPRRL